MLKPSPIIDVSNLDFAYRDQLVLKHIDLRVERGSTLGVIGPNGGGKTTLVQLMLGLLEPTRGTITIDGSTGDSTGDSTSDSKADSTDDSARSAIARKVGGKLTPRQAVQRGDVIGYVPQRPAQPSPNFPLSVRQLARLGLVGKTGMLRAHSRDDLAFVDDLLERVGVSEIANESVGALSGGQLQRVLIARALAARPKLLLLDEPTTGIDRGGQQRFVESIAELKRALDLTVVIVSHDLRAVSTMSDRIACLNVTLHYHDVPERLPADLIYGMFACDLQALTSPHSCSPAHLPISGAEINRV